MSLPSTISNIIISGNTIDGGSSSSGSFTYASLLYTYADCRVFNNYLSGIQSSISIAIMCVLDGCSCNIQGNTFVRGNSAIKYYIDATNTTDQIITGNIFDGYTVDGTNTVLVHNLTANSLYTANKNQTGYAIIPLGTNKPAIFQYGSLFDGLFVTSDVPPDSATDYGVAGGDLFDPFVLKIYDDTASPSNRFFTMNIDITKSIPVGAKILDAKISIYNPSSIALDTSTSNQFNLFLVSGLNHTSSVDVKTYDSAGIASIMFGYVSQAQLMINAGNEPNMRSTYQVLEIPTLNFTGNAATTGNATAPISNTDISKNYVSGNEYNISANLLFFYKASSQGTAGIPLIVVSPLIINYVW